MTKEAGFTLIELIVTVALVAILVTVGIPAFQETVASNRLAAAANQFVTALNLARSEALKRNVRVTLCKWDGNQCVATGGYEQGWRIFVDPDNDATWDPGEVVIQDTPAFSPDLTLIGLANVQNFISYTPSGSSKLVGGGFQAGTLNLCKSNYTTQSRRIFIARGGRTRVEVIKPPDDLKCPP